MFQSVKSNKVYGEIMEQVKRAIREGKLKPGDKLPPERELTKMFEASRPSLREALTALEICGIVETRRGVGTFITTDIETNIDSPVFSDLKMETSPIALMEARKVIEAAVVEVAAVMLNEDDVNYLRQLALTLETTTDPKEHLNTDYLFHLGIARCTGNPLLTEIMECLIAKMQERLLLKLDEQSLENRDNSLRSIREHNVILQALEKHDPKLARLALEEHLQNVIEYDFQLGDSDDE